MPVLKREEDNVVVRGGDVHTLLGKGSEFEGKLTFEGNFVGDATQQSIQTSIEGRVVQCWQIQALVDAKTKTLTIQGVGFLTKWAPSGKIEIHSSTIAGFGYDDCPGHPTWLPPSDGHGSAATKHLPLQLIANQPATRLHSQLDFGATSVASKCSA